LVAGLAGVSQDSFFANAQGLLEAVLPNIPMAMLLIAFFYLAGVTWDFLRQVLRMAVMGDSSVSRQSVFCKTPETLPVRAHGYRRVSGRPGVDPRRGGRFWINAGTLEWLDHLLLWQLWLCAGIAWVYLLLAVDGRGRLRDARSKPSRRCSRRQGWHAILFPSPEASA